MLPDTLHEEVNPAPGPQRGPRVYGPCWYSDDSQALPGWVSGCYCLPSGVSFHCGSAMERRIVVPQGRGHPEPPSAGSLGVRVFADAAKVRTPR